MSRRLNGSSLLHRSHLAICCGLALFFLFGDTVLSQENSGSSMLKVENLTLGFSGAGRVGTWLPVELRAQGVSPDAEVTLRMTASDPRGDQCESIVASAKADSGGSVTLNGVFMAGRIDSPIRLQLIDTSDAVLWQHSVSCRPGKTGKPSTNPTPAAQELNSSELMSQMTLLRHQSQTVLTIGSPVGLPELEERLTGASGTRGELTLLILDSLQSLPTTRRGLDSIDTVVLVSDYGLSEQQTEALQDWVVTGGHLLVSCGENLTGLLASPVGRWLQPRFGIQDGLLSSQDLTALQNYVAGASQLQTNRQNVSIVQMNSDQTRTVVNSINGPLISRLSMGAGLVTVVAVDLNQRPLNRWLSLSQFYEMLLFDRLLESGTEQSRRGGRISSSGVTDLATQLANVSDAIPAAERWSSWHAMVMMLVYLIIIGPMDYFFVVRLLRRPKLTWITFPSLVAIACGLTVWWSTSHRAAATVRTVHLLDVGHNGIDQTLHARTWSSLSTTDSRFGSVSMTSSPLIVGKAVKQTEETVNWHGRAEDVYGGMYRPGGAGLGQQLSRRTETGPPRFDSVPLVVDGSQAFLAESFSHAESSSIFESQLIMPASGLLEGSFVHHLPVAIQDWVIVFGNRVYMPSQKAEEGFRQIEPGKPWSRNRGNVRVAEIRDFLRGVRVVSRERKKGDTKSNPTTQIQSLYNSTGTNPLDILLMVSLYNMAGGEVYVKLQNNYLRHDEVSDAIQLNTALLMGLADLPLTQLNLDGTVVEPTKTQTVVRFLLPVDRTGNAGALNEADPKADKP